VKLGNLAEGSWRHLDAAEIESLERIFSAAAIVSVNESSEGVHQ
jgi:hypothetical protein